MRKRIQLIPELKCVLLATINIHKQHERQRKEDQNGQEDKGRSDLTISISDSANNGRSKDTGSFVGNGKERIEGRLVPRWDEFGEEASAVRR